MKIPYLALSTFGLMSLAQAATIPGSCSTPGSCGDLVPTFQEVNVKTDLNLVDADGSNFMGIKSPAVVTADTVLTLPDGAGSNGEVLTTDGSGNMSWSAIASGLWTGSGSDVYFSTGSVGVGTSTPGYALDVQNSAGGALFRVKDTDSTHEGLALTADTNGGAIGNGTGGSFKESIYFQDSASAIRMFTNGTEKLRVTSTGNVGVGTTGPLYKLDVRGKTRVGDNIDVSPTAGGDGQLIIDGNGYAGYVALDGTAMHIGTNSGSRNLAFQTDETTRMVVSPAGNIGIGTTTPAVELDVNTGTINAAAICDEDNANCIDLSAGVSGGASAINDLTDGASSASSLFLGSIGGTFGSQNQFNVGVGMGALDSLNNSNANGLFSGQYNTALGYNSLANATTTSRNVAVGSNALENLGTSGQHNVAVGYNALKATTYSDGSIAIGADAMLDNTTGAGIAIGKNALSSNTTGTQNIAVGTNAMNSLVTGISNTAIGNDTMTTLDGGDENVAVGRFAMRYGTSASSNVAVGDSSLRDVTTGWGNVAVGRRASYNIESGTNNVAVGYDAANTLTTGQYNTLLGSKTSSGITTGNFNTVVGAQVTGLSPTLSNNIILADGQGNQRINIDASGNVGVGTATPAVELDIDAGTINAAAICDESNANCIDLSAGLSGGKFVDGTAAADAVFTGGNVGVGTTAPDANLEIRGAGGGPEVLKVSQINTGFSNANIMTIDTSALINASTVGALNIENGTDSLFYVRGDGNVGIGTTSPSEELEVSAAAGNPTISIKPQAANAYSYLKLIGTLGGVESESSVFAAYNGSLNFDTPTAYQFRTNNTERIRIDSAGRVGIGTTTPADTLSVVGGYPTTAGFYRDFDASSSVAGTAIEIGAKDGTALTPSIELIGTLDATGATNEGEFGVNVLDGGGMSRKFTITNEGSIGMGISNPSDSLNVVRSKTDSQWVGNFDGQNGSNYGMRVNIANTTSNRDILRLQAGGSDVMVVEGGGNVGIGTTTPAQKLHVEGGHLQITNPTNANIGITSGAYSTQIVNYESGASYLSSDANAMIFQNTNAAGVLLFAPNSVEKMRISSAGNVGIGATAPATALHVSSADLSPLRVEGSAVMTGIELKNAAGGIWRIANNATYASGSWNPGSLQIYDQVAASIRFTIQDGNGNVGIGTGSPAQKLDVAGNIAVSGTTVHTSDERLKESIVGLEGSLEKIQALNGVEYYWKDKAVSADKQIGVTAQNVQSQFPELVYTNEETGDLSVNYSGLIAPLIEGMKELKTENDTLRAEMKEIKEQINLLKTQ